MKAATRWICWGTILLLIVGGCNGRSAEPDAAGAAGSGEAGQANASDGGTAAGGDGRAGDSATIGGGGAAGGVGGEGFGGESGSIITADSDAIEIDWFNFFSGGYRFERTLEQLSPQQLELAKAIEIVPATDACAEDADEISIKVAGGNTTREFFANDYTGSCGRSGTLVSYDAVKALLATVHCLPAKGYDGTSADTAPSIHPDDGCWHGLFNGSGATPEWWFRIEIPAAGEYRVALDACGDRKLSLELFEDDAATVVASTSGDSDCPVLKQAFAGAGNYVLRVQMLSGRLAGDFYLAIDSAN